MKLFVLEMAWSYVFTPLQAIVVVIRDVTTEAVKNTKDNPTFGRDRSSFFQISWMRVD